MALFDINTIIFFVTFLIIYGIFLIFDAFKRNEKYGYFAYIIALLPINFLWILYYTDPLVTYLVLFILWTLCLLRDLWGVHKEKKQINEIVLYLVLAIIIQLILAAILPESIPNLKTNNTQWLFFWLPDLYTTTWGIELWVNLNVLIAFRIMASLLIFFVIIPLIVDIRGEDVPLPLFIIIIALFIPPFLYLSYVWLPQATGVLTFLMCVILFVCLLIITRSGKEVK
ncbi:MAG: hypothetical protein ACFE85_03260 [Candidatus Hodarchaeota archaeon]